MPRPFLGYVRVSRVGEREATLISPDLQRERIEGFCRARNLPLVMLEAELDVSGGRVERPVLGRALESIEAGEAAGIIVAQLDRLSRLSLVDALRVIERVEGVGGQVLTVSENFDAGTPAGRMSRNFFLSIADYQLTIYKSQFATAKRQAVERGIWPMPVVPRGYRKGTDRRLVPGPEAPVVVEAYHLRAAGNPWSVVAGHIGCGVSGAARLIRNRVYLGEIHLGEWVNRDAHPALVSRDLWEAAQLDHPRPPRGTRGPALLLGLLRCAGCQRTMTPDTDRYRCFARNAGGVCPAPASIARSLVEPIIERTVLSHLADLTYEAHEATDATEEPKRQLAEAEAELAAYQEAVSATETGAEHFARGLEKRVAAVEDARRDVAAAFMREPARGSQGDLGALWPELDVIERRQVLRGALGVVWVRKGRGPDRIRIVAAGFEPRNLSRPGRHAGGIEPLAWNRDLDGEIIPVVDEPGEGSSGSGA